MARKTPEQRYLDCLKEVHTNLSLELRVLHAYGEQDTYFAKFATRMIARINRTVKPDARNP